MKKVSIIGATGYAGAELLRILHNHPEADCFPRRKSSISIKGYGQK